VKSINDIITERLEKKRQSLLMSPYQSIKKSEPRKITHAPTLKLYARRDFLHELIIQRLDTLMKSML
jgi:hypothetical protein